MDWPIVAVAVLGAVVLGGSVAGALLPEIHPREQRVFRAVNGLPGWLYWPLWGPMQLGNLVVGTLVGLVTAWVAREPAVAVGVVLAMVLKLVTERVVRREMKAYLAVRERPGTSQDGAVLRGGDVPAVGASFPSGHVILVAAIGCVVGPILPAAWVWAPFLVTAVVMIGRVYVGAHNPLDVTAGLGVGLLLGGVVAGFIG